MAFETKEEVLHRCMQMEKPKCPHCNQEMSLWEVPPINFSDGLGWGTPYLFVCFNDECPSYIRGWDNLQENFAHRASYRCISYPGGSNFEYMPVFSPVGGTGQVITDQAVAEQEALKEATKRGFSVLAECYNSKDYAQMMHILMDSTEPVRVRIKAAEMIGDLGEPEAVEPLRHMRAGNQKLQEQIDTAVANIHERFYTRECPFCAEIIKQRAKVCKHCGHEVAGE